MLGQGYKQSGPVLWFKSFEISAQFAQVLIQETEQSLLKLC
jgi:hypothetical protein